MPDGKMWIQRDRFGNDIYLTYERWKHITDQDQETIKLGRRRQDPYDPHSYKYYWPFPDLPDDNTHLVVCVRFHWEVEPDGITREEKFVTTAYFQWF